jgi:predicted Rossmann-fold nucleotide-binding protein
VEWCGITCDEIEDWRPVAPNAWITEERRYPTLRQRLFALIEGCDAAIAMPGGIGTLAEITQMWSQIQCQAISPRPMILVGAGWQDTFNAFYSSFDVYIPQPYRQLLTFVENVEAAVTYVNNSLPD